MKRFTVLAVAVLVVVAMAVCSADAADYSGKWIAFKMDITEGEEHMIVDLDEYEMPDEMRSTLEFRDGKAYFAKDAEDEDPDGMEYTVVGDKLSVIVPQEAKDQGMESADIFFEGDALCMLFTQSDGSIKFVFRKL